MKKMYKKIREYIPLFSLIMLILSIISLVIFIIVLNSVKFADFFNYNIASVARQALAHSTSWIPFSVAELFIILIPIWLVLLIFAVVKTAKRGIKRRFTPIVDMFSTGCGKFFLTLHKQRH